jgi:hypothetical protein
MAQRAGTRTSDGQRRPEPPLLLSLLALGLAVAACGQPGNDRRTRSGSGGAGTVADTGGSGGGGAGPSAGTGGRSGTGGTTGGSGTGGSAMDASVTGGSGAGGSNPNNSNTGGSGGSGGAKGSGGSGGTAAMGTEPSGAAWGRAELCGDYCKCMGSGKCTGNAPSNCDATCKSNADNWNLPCRIEKCTSANKDYSDQISGSCASAAGSQGCWNKDVLTKP